MNTNSKIVGVILAGGVGKRFGAKIPKQFLKIKQKRVIDYSIDVFKEVCDELIIVCDESYFHYFKNSFTCVLSGEERYLSLENAFNYIKTKYGNNTIVVTHDSARPLIKKQLLNDLIQKTKKYNCVSLSTQPSSTYATKQSIINRDDLYEILTPQCVKLGNYFIENRVLNEKCTDLVSYMYLNNQSVYFETTQTPNIKITHPKDLKLVQYFMENDYE